MNKTEAVVLCRYVKALCPAQAFDEYTPDAWADVMWDIGADDAKQAVQEMIREGEKFINPGAIIGKVRRIRQKRCMSFPGNPSPPPGLTDGEYSEWHRQTWGAIADGRAKTMADLGLPEPEHLQNPEGVKRLAELTRGALRMPSADATSAETPADYAAARAQLAGRMTVPSKFEPTEEPA